MCHFYFYLFYDQKPYMSKNKYNFLLKHSKLSYLFWSESVTRKLYILNVVTWTIQHFFKFLQHITFYLSPWFWQEPKKSLLFLQKFPQNTIKIREKKTLICVMMQTFLDLFQLVNLTPKLYILYLIFLSGEGLTFTRKY